MNSKKTTKKGVKGKAGSHNESSVSWTTPTVVRVMLPLALMDMVRRADGEPEGFLAIFETLRETLNTDATAEEVRKSVVGL
jgi:hypothetical protein